MKTNNFKNECKIQKKRLVNVQQQHLLVQREFQLKGPPHKLRDFDPRFSKDEGQRASIIKLPTMLPLS